MNRLLIAVCLALAATLCLSAASEAHKVNIFAYVDGDTIVTDSGYSKSRRVQGGTVEVRDAASGKVLLSGTTDDEGRFAFPIPASAREGKMDLRLVLVAGEGHQTDWVVKYAEFGEADVPAPAAEPVDRPIAAASPAPSFAAAAPGGGVTAAEVDAIVKRELAPVKRMLADMNQSGPSMTEIIGGIGWILGLFGIAAYMKGRSKSG